MTHHIAWILVLFLSFFSICTPADEEFSVVGEGSNAQEAIANAWSKAMQQYLQGNLNSLMLHNNKDKIALFIKNEWKKYAQGNGEKPQIVRPFANGKIIIKVQLQEKLLLKDVKALCDAKPATDKTTVPTNDQTPITTPNSAMSAREIALNFAKADDPLPYCSKDFAAILQSAKKNKNQLEEIKFQQENVVGSNMEVVLAVTKKGKKNNLTIALIKEDGQWRVDDMLTTSPDGKKVSAKLLFGAFQGMKKTFEVDTPQKSLYKQTVDGIEIQLISITKKENDWELVFYHQNEEDKKYSLALVQADGFVKSKNNYGSWQGSGRNVQTTLYLTPQSGAVLEKTNLVVVLQQEASLKSAKLCLEIRVGQVNVIEELNQEATQDGVTIKLHKFGLLYGKTAMRFKPHTKKAEQEHSYGNAKAYVYPADKAGETWYSLFLIGSFQPSGKLFSEEGKINRNIRIYNLDKKGTEIHTTAFEISRVGDTTYFFKEIPLFDKKMERIQLCYFSPEFYQKNTRTYNLQGIELKPSAK